MLGKGSSDRPDNFDKDNMSPEECADYFIDALEEWRRQTDDLTGFFLAGHSFGGHLTGLYTVRYPNHVKKLLIMSPIGVGYFTDSDLREYNSFDGVAGRR